MHSRAKYCANLRVKSAINRLLRARKV